MKVHELMAILMRRPAGDDVVLAHSAYSYRVNLIGVDSTDEELVVLVGDGLMTIEEDDETPQPPKRKAVPRARK